MCLIKLKKYIKEGSHIPLNNMKKIIRLNESELFSLIKKIIKEDLEIAPYKLKAVGGNVKINNAKTGKTFIYSLEIKILGFRKTVYVNSINLSLDSILFAHKLIKNMLNDLRFSFILLILQNSS